MLPPACMLAIKIIPLAFHSASGARLSQPQHVQPRYDIKFAPVRFRTARALRLRQARSKAIVAVSRCVALLLLFVGLAGCTPAGPRALLEGKRLLERERYPQAVEQLRTATGLMTTNAQAWNYLGI